MLLYNMIRHSPADDPLSRGSIIIEKKEEGIGLRGYQIFGPFCHLAGCWLVAVAVMAGSMQCSSAREWLDHIAVCSDLIESSQSSIRPWKRPVNHRLKIRQAAKVMHRGQSACIFDSLDSSSKIDRQTVLITYLIPQLHQGSLYYCTIQVFLI